MSPTKMVEPLEMLFGMRTRVLDGLEITPWEGAVLREEQ